jgi:ABC-2 type transport system ATP-binding protein
LWVTLAQAFAVQTEGLVKRYDELVAVDDLNLEIAQGEIFGLLGPNGSGKTTTISMVSGLIAPTAGSVRVLGFDVKKQAAEVRRLLGIVPQETALYEELSAVQNMEFHADLYGVPKQEKNSRIKQLLELVGLSERQSEPVSHYSGGMKRRLALARALLHEPKFMILDEPTLGVDVQSRGAIWDHIKELPKQGRTVLLATNYLEEASRLCDRIGIIDHGKLVVQGTPGELTHRFGHTVVEMETQAPPSPAVLTSLKGLQGVISVDQKAPTQVMVALEGEGLPPALLDTISRQLTILKLVVREPTLEEAFLRLTGKELRD